MVPQQDLDKLRRRVDELERSESQSRAKEDRLSALVHELEVHREELRTQNEQMLRTQQELERSHQRYVDLFEYAPVGYLLLDRDGLIHALNMQGAGMLRRARGALIGKPLWLYLSTGFRDKLGRHLRDVFHRGHASLELQFTRSDESLFHAAAKTVLVSESEQPASFCRMAILDISERKAAEEALRESEVRFRNLIEGSIQGIFIHREWRPIFANQAYADLLGYDSPTEILALDSIKPHIAPHDRERLDNFLAARLRGAADLPIQYEYDAMRKDGTVITLNKVVRLITWDGKPAIQDTVVDVTAHKEAEKRARQHQAELAHMARLNTLGEMASGLAHELNQPLTAIVSYAEGAARRYQSQTGDDSPLLEVLNRTGKLAKRAAEIVKGLHSLVRKRDPRWDSLSVNHVVKEAVSIVAPEAERKSVEIVQELSPRIPHVQGDFVQLEQVVLNLFLNGIEAIDQSRSNPRVITVRTLLNGDGDVELMVHDSGPGLQADIVPRMFDAFVTTKEEGLGMGLSISRTIVESHGGRLWGYSRYDGGGCTFHVALPFDRNDGDGR